MEGNAIAYLPTDTDIGLSLACLREILEDLPGNMINIELPVGKDKVILAWLLNLPYRVGWATAFAIVPYNLGACFVTWKEVPNACKSLIRPVIKQTLHLLLS